MGEDTFRYPDLKVLIAPPRTVQLRLQRGEPVIEPLLARQMRIAPIQNIQEKLLGGKDALTGPVDYGRIYNIDISICLLNISREAKFCVFLNIHAAPDHFTRIKWTQSPLEKSRKHRAIGNEHLIRRTESRIDLLRGIHRGIFSSHH